MPSTVVNGLGLPEDLIVLMDAGRWKPPTALTGLTRLIPENSGLHPYSISQMEFETKTCYLQGRMWQGVPDPNNSPGDIDPHLTVFIADIGHGFDQPIALDYRVSPERPRVLTLRWSERGERNRWIVIAPDIMAFAELVGL
jgi:hypothetical protein